MNLGEIFRKLTGKADRPTAADLNEVKLPPGISPEYHRNFFSETSALIEKIREGQQFIMSRPVRAQVDEMCEAVTRIAARCHVDPEGIFYARDLKIALALVPTMLRDYDHRHQIDPLNESPEQAALREQIKEMVLVAKTIERDMASGITANLDAHNRTLAGILQRYRGGNLELASLTEEASI